MPPARAVPSTAAVDRSGRHALGWRAAAVGLWFALGLGVLPALWRWLGHD